MAADALDRAFGALADGTRRGVVELLRKRPHRAGELADTLEVSPPALSRHLRVLRDSGLVEETHDAGDARVSVYRLRRQPFTQLERWIDDVQALWTTQLEAFAVHVRKRSKATS